MDAFEREKKIGQGAFGCALLIKRKKDGKRMVAKEINVAGMPEKDQLSAMQEVNVMQALKHRNIVTLHKSFLESGNLYIVMEYAEGGDLAGFLKRSKQAGRPLPEEKVLQTVGEILSGLEHVHANKFVHRDIKPANVLLCKNGVAKLADFGVSRVLSYTMEEARTMIGTPYYLAPEMIEDKGYSYPADIWSTGVLMYEMLTFTHPFTGGNLPALILNIMKAKPKPLPKFYSADMQKVLNKMLCFDPGARLSANACLAQAIFCKSPAHGAPAGLHDATSSLEPEAVAPPRRASDEKAGWAVGAARADAEGPRGAKGGREGQGARVGAGDVGAGVEKDKDKDRGEKGVARRLMAPADKKKAGHDMGGAGGHGPRAPPSAPQRSKSTEPALLAKDRDQHRDQHRDQQHQQHGLSPVPPRSRTPGKGPHIVAGGGGGVVGAGASARKPPAVGVLKSDDEVRREKIVREARDAASEVACLPDSPGKKRTPADDELALQRQLAKLCK